ncbi:MAG: xanthine dehydrogenase family protein molybdopterin-binding subunit [Nitrososphaerales archaeon]|jgi:xanthine dehydrogenase molybdenum-binding subunit
MTYTILGNPDIKRRSLMERITGTNHYTEDISASDLGASNMVYMGLVTCPYPRATVKSIDVSQAEAAGYVTLTGFDLPAYNYSNPGRPYVPIASDTVLFSGQPVVAVAANSPEEVVDAEDLVVVEYEPLTPVFDPEEALAPGAPQLFEGGNSLIGPTPMTTKFGDPDGALSQADTVISLRYDYPVITHFELEPDGCVASWSNGTLNTYQKTSYVWGDLYGLAAYFGIPMSDVVCRGGLGGTTNSMAGGMFGNSMQGDMLIVAAVMSKKVGAPVKWVATRYENARATSNRFPIRGYVTLGAKAGVLTALKVNLYFNMGARGGAVADGPDDLYNLYVIPNVEVNSYFASTNSYGIGAYMRDVGESQCHFMLESTIDMMAQKLNVDPTQFRLNNMRTGGPNAVDPSDGIPYSQLNQPATFNAGLNSFNWSSQWKGWGVPSSVNGPKRRGVGVALESGNKGAAFGPSSGQIQVNPDGSVVVFHCTGDHGGGSTTSVPIQAAQALGLSSLDNVSMVSADTSLTTDGGVTAGSQMTQCGGFAMIAAALDLGNQWFPLVAAKLAPGTKASNLAFGGGVGAGITGLGASISNQPGGMIYDTTNPANQMSWKAAAALLPGPITGHGNGNPLINFGLTHREVGAKFAEVEVDTETGDVRVVNAVSALDLGRVNWAKGAQSQMEGGFIGLGQGEVFFEEHLLDPTTGFNYSGRTINSNFLDYKVPTIMQVPDTFTALPVEGVDPSGPFGAKGIGENCVTSSSAAIANALSNALGGYRFIRAPIRKGDIIAALQYMQANGEL